MRRKQEIERLELKTEELMSYLVRLYLFQESSSIYVWSVAAYEVLHSTYRVGILHRFLSADTIFESTFTSNYHVLKPMIDTYIKIQNDGYYNDILRDKYIFYKEPISMVASYLRKLSEKLSSDGCASFNDIEKYLRVTGFIA